MLNTNRLLNLITSGKLTKAQLCTKAKIGRPTLDAILNGSDAKVSTIEAIASVLCVRIGYLFDEEVVVNNATASHHSVAFAGDNNSGAIGCAIDPVSAERIKSLETLIVEKDERIKELKERIDELKAK